MIDPRWRKVLRDAWLHKSRTALVVAAIALGMLGAGAILDTWALVQRVTREGYAASRPVSATLTIGKLDAALIERVRALPEVQAVRARRTVAAAAQTGGTWRRALLFALDDYASADIGRLTGEVGSWPPRDGEIVIERSSLDFSGATLGEPLALAIGQAPAQSLPVSGIVRDVSLAPGWMEHLIYAYVTPATLEQLGAPAAFDELQVRVRDAGADRATVRRIAGSIRKLAEDDGYRVTDVAVPEPGQHIHAAQMDSLLMTQGAFGLLALLVCAFLVVNLITAMLAGQVREIGVMKTLGAGSGQIAGMYLSLALLLGAIATAIAVPAAAALGHQYAAFKADLLNFPIAGYSIPWWAIALQVVVGCLLPVAAAAIPVYRGCRLPVSAALREFGLGADATGGRITRRIGFGGLGRPLLLSLSNAFRRRQRMALTLLALAAGGAVYLGAENLRVAVRGSVDLLFATQRFDFSLRLADAHPPERIAAVVAGVDGVARSEAWTGARAAVVHAGDSLGNTFALTAVPPDTAMLAPVIEAGRWLESTDDKALVVGRGLLRGEPGLKVGDAVSLRIDGEDSQWTVVGSADTGPAPTAYAPRAALARLRGEDRAAAVVVASTIRGSGSQLDLIRRLREELERAGMPVANSQLLSENRRVVEDHLLMVVDFLGLMGWVMIAVGGMGLASTMGMAVLERTREIGVLRAIGARHRAIVGMLEVEGLVIAVLGWLVSLPLSIPMSVALGTAFGRVMFPVPISYVPEGGGVLRWLAVVVVVSLLACAWPAIRATRIPTAAALKYE